MRHPHHIGDSAHDVRTERFATVTIYRLRYRLRYRVRNGRCCRLHRRQLTRSTLCRHLGRRHRYRVDRPGLARRRLEDHDLPGNAYRCDVGNNCFAIRSDGLVDVGRGGTGRKRTQQHWKNESEKRGVGADWALYRGQKGQASNPADRFSPRLLLNIFHVA